MDKKIIFIHGYTASSRADWYPNIKPELDKLGVDYSMPDLPGGTHPHSREWLEIIDNEVKSTTKPIVLVGHSLGTRAALLYLDKFEPKVDTVLLIAAFNNDWEVNKKRRDGNYADFFEYPLDLEKIKHSAKKFIVMHAKDDESINYSQGVEISEELGAELITYEDRKHFSAPENYTYVLEVLKKILER